ncbi:MAG: urease accessory protein UreG, partial [Firmicutes bacterium]|nr:urease accessory protein UreG [Bacillota bacterium]
VMTADLLVINKIDLAPYVRADLDVMAKDSQMVREGRPFIFTNCFDGTGIADVGEWIIAQVLATEAVDG